MKIQENNYSLEHRLDLIHNRFDADFAISIDILVATNCVTFSPSKRSQNGMIRLMQISQNEIELSQ